MRLFTVPEPLREYSCAAKASVMYWTYVRSPVSWPLVPTELLRLITKRKTSFRRRILHTGVSSGIDFTPGKTYSVDLNRIVFDWANFIHKSVHAFHTLMNTHVYICILSYQKYLYWNQNLEHHYFQEFEQFTFSKLFLPFKRNICKIKLQWYCYH